MGGFKMGRFLETEKHRQAQLKATSSLFSNAARTDGYFKNKPWPFCLPLEKADENLFEEVRQPAIKYFAKEKIQWHQGRNGNPSNHLCDSQVCCVNFLFPFSNKPQALVELLRSLFPDVQEMLPIENSGQFISFEWIGLENYLGERKAGNGSRTRGANFTSADAAVMFKRTDGQKHFVLIEWKYTESYGGTPLQIAKSGTDRTKIYEHLFVRDDCPIDKKILPDFESLFFEPFYQFMRQQFLAHEMELNRELGADIVTLLHISPKHNTDFLKITSPKLKGLGKSAIEVWKNLVNTDRFISVSAEEMFGSSAVQKLQEMKAWREYVNERYSWIVGIH